MKVLLISANTIRVPYYIYPLGLDYVAGAIPDRHTVKIVDINIVNNVNCLIDVIDGFNPHVIGISLRNIDNVEMNDTRGFLKEYRDLLDMIRKHSTATIVLGGSGFTIFPRRLMDLLKADYGIIGEGERLPMLLDALESGGDILAVPGVIAAGIKEKFPPPLGIPFKNIVRSNTIAEFYIAHGGMLNLQTKRGCPYNCIYCTYPHIEGTDLRLVPADQVADNARELERAGAKYLCITDAVFNTSYEHSIEVAHAFAGQGISIPWGAFLTPTKLTENYCRILHEAGMTHAEFGTEALSGSMLASYQKPFSVDDVFEAHTAALDAGLHVAHYILLGGPGENSDTVMETLIKVEQLERTVIFFFCGIRIYPHTQIYDIAMQEGQISESDDLLEPVFYQSRFIKGQEILCMIKKHAKGRENWVIGSGGYAASRLLSRLYKHGYSGPLWERLIR
jgi:radical SAM superfamily enzyme YgiQ (UPF0313 family)